MRQLVFSLICAAFFISAGSFTSRGNGEKAIANKAKVEVVFNRESEFSDIVKIKLDLAQKGIIMNYRKLEFDKEGKLSFIDFYVDCKDGFAGGAAQRNLTNQSHFGFYRDYSPATDSPFGTGNF